MAMFRFSVLGSGSSGNASLLEAGGFGVLVDAGLGPRQLAARLAQAGAGWQHIHAVLLTHVHTDHWNERTFAHLVRCGIPLYCHGEHQKHLAVESPAFAELRAGDLVRIYRPHEELPLGSKLRCRPIPLAHDGGVTCGFRFEGEADIFGRCSALGYAADLGSWQADLATALKDVDILALEFNHDVEMEQNSGRSPGLIGRVLGDQGHLSNEQAAGLLSAIVSRSEPGRLRHLVQLHLSRQCNHPRLAQAAARTLLAEHGIRVHSARHDRTGPSLTVGRSLAARRRSPRRQIKTNRDQPCFADWE
jgi:phosphoribosyl 1,2-cyclic phosphodiesterase